METVKIMVDNKELDFIVEDTMEIERNDDFYNEDTINLSGVVSVIKDSFMGSDNNG